MSEKKGIPIPNQRNGRSGRSNRYSCSLNSTPATPYETPPKTILGSTPQHGDHFNVYTVSPRTTSIMFQYYSSPHAFHQQQQHSMQSRSSRCIKSTSNESTLSSPPPTASSSQNSVNTDHSSFNCSNNDYCNYPNHVGGGTHHHHHHKSKQLHRQFNLENEGRRRSYSESDQKNKSELSSSSQQRNPRLSALRKLRRKLSRTVSLSKKNTNHQNNKTHEDEDEDQFSIPSNSYTSQSPLQSSNRHLDNIFSSLQLEDDVVGSCNSLSVVEPDLVYQRFLQEHTCYDIMPTSCKVVAFDTKLQARQAFHALMANGERSAPLWDSSTQSYCGMLTVTDFIDIIITYERTKESKLKSLEDETIETWRKTLDKDGHFTSISPNNSLLDSLQLLHDKDLNGLPICDDLSGDVFHTITHKRILRFIHLFINEIPMPGFLTQTLEQSGIGRHGDEVITVKRDDSLLHALLLIAEDKLFGLPVVDENGRVVDVFCKMDMISLAAQNMYHNLQMEVKDALKLRYSLVNDQPSTTTTTNEHNNNYARSSSLTSPHDHSTSSNHHQRPHSSYVPTHHHRKSNDEKHHHSKKHFLQRGNSEESKSGRRRTKSNQHSSAAHHHVTPPSLSSNLSSSLQDSKSSISSRSKPISRYQALVKCKLSNTLNEIIERLVTTDIDMLVVVDEDDHIQGVVTCADFTNYIVDPKGEKLWSGAEQEKQRRELLRHKHRLFLLRGPARLRRTSAPEWRTRRNELNDRMSSMMTYNSFDTNGEEEEVTSSSSEEDSSSSVVTSQSSEEDLRSLNDDEVKITSIDQEFCSARS